MKQTHDSEVKETRNNLGTKQLQPGLILRSSLPRNVSESKILFRTRSWGNSLLVLDLSLDILDGVRGFDLKGDRFSREGFNEDLHIWPTLPS